MNKKVITKFLAIVTSAVMLAGAFVISAASPVIAVEAADNVDQALRNNFDAVFYANKYADVKAAFGTDANALFNHFKQHGMTEGRMMNVNFDPKAYISAYSDVAAYCNGDYRKAYEHYVMHGIAEGRTLTTGDALNKKWADEAKAEEKKNNNNDNDNKDDSWCPFCHHHWWDCGWWDCDWCWTRYNWHHNDPWYFDRCGFGLPAWWGMDCFWGQPAPVAPAFNFAPAPVIPAFNPAPPAPCFDPCFDPCFNPCFDPAPPAPEFDFAPPAPDFDPGFGGPGGPGGPDFGPMPMVFFQ